MKHFLAMGLLAVGMMALGTAAARANWALSVGQDGSKHWLTARRGTSRRQRSPAGKRSPNCQSRGQNCKVVLDGVGGCVALAVGIADNAWHAKQSKTRLSAAQAALDECVKASSGDCEVKHSFCEE